MSEKCIICSKKMENNEFGKLQGTIIKVLEDKKNRQVHVCSECMQEEGWIERAKIKSA